MAEFYCEKTANGVYAYGAESKEELKKLKYGEAFKCKAVPNRTARFHRKYFSLINTAFDNQDKYGSKKAFRTELTLLAGWYDAHIRADGSTTLIPRSIAFDKMDESEFSDLYSATIDAILQNFMVGTTEEQLMQIISYA